MNSPSLKLNVLMFADGDQQAVISDFVDSVQSAVSEPIPSTLSLFELFDKAEEASIPFETWVLKKRQYRMQDKCFSGETGSTVEQPVLDISSSLRAMLEIALADRDEYAALQRAKLELAELRKDLPGSVSIAPISLGLDQSQSLN